MLTHFLLDDSMQNQSIKNLYKYIKEHGPVVRSDMINHTNLSKAKITRTLNELLEKNFIQIVGQGESEGGRPPSLYQINPSSGYIIGIWIRMVETKIVMFDLLFNKIEEKVITMSTEHTAHVLIDELIQTIDFFLKKNNLSHDNLLGIGIGAKGPLNQEKGIIINPENFLAPGWNDIPIVDMIRKKIPVRVLLEYGANVGALGDYKENIIFNNILNIIVGLDLGCGVIMDGTLLNTNSNDLTKIGHMNVELDGRTCNCGKKGCVISYITLHAILDEIQKLFPDFFTKNLQGYHGFSIDKLMDVLLRGRSEIDGIDTIILDSTKYLGVWLANLAIAYHTELIVLNGPLINHYPGYFEQTVFNALSHLDSGKRVKITKGIHEEESAVFGAAHLLFDSFFDKSYSFR